MSLHVWSVIASFLTDVKDIIAFELTSKLHRNAGYVGVTYIECKGFWNTYTYSKCARPQQNWIMNGSIIPWIYEKYWHLSVSSDDPIYNEVDINKTYDHYGKQRKYINIPPIKWIYHHTNLIRIDYPLFLEWRCSISSELCKVFKKLPNLKKVQFYTMYSLKALKALFRIKPSIIGYDISFFDELGNLHHSRIRFDNTLILNGDINESFMEKIPKEITTIIYHTNNMLKNESLEVLALSRKVIVLTYNNTGNILRLLNYNQAVELYIYARTKLNKCEIEEIKQIASIRKVVIITNENILLNSPNITILEDNKCNRDIYGYVVN